MIWSLEYYIQFLKLTKLKSSLEGFLAVESISTQISQIRSLLFSCAGSFLDLLVRCTRDRSSKKDAAFAILSLKQFSAQLSSPGA
jgi:hypothetical protein